jgi:hypothetical protein
MGNRGATRRAQSGWYMCSVEPGMAKGPERRHYHADQGFSHSCLLGHGQQHSVLHQYVTVTVGKVLFEQRQEDRTTRRD